MSEFTQGKCHCGQVSIIAPAKPNFAFSCHCSACRKLSSGGRLLGHGTSKDDITIAGETREYRYVGDSGNDVILHFCPNCSTQIYGEPLAFPGMAAVRASLLDNESEFLPAQFIHTDAAYKWDKIE